MTADLAAVDFVSSPLSRALDTMELLRAELHLPPRDYRVDSQLLELHYGHWEGHLASALSEVDPEGAAAKALDPFAWRPTGGESYADLMERVAVWLRSLNRDTLAITHGGVTRVARGALLGLDTREVTTLEVPQDKILMFRDGQMSWL